MELGQQTLLDYMEHPDDWVEEELCLVRGSEEEFKKANEMMVKRIEGTLSDEEFFSNPLPNIEYGFMIKHFGPIVFIGIAGMRSTKHIKYPSFAAILADKWELD